MNPEQPELQQPEDLFEWGKENTKTKSEKDDLGWDCPQCELLGRLCARHLHINSDDRQPLGQEEYLHDKIIEHEIEVQGARKKSKEPASEEEINVFFEETKRKLAS